MNEECIAWLRSNIDRIDMKFLHFDMFNQLYRPSGNRRDTVNVPKTDAHGQYDAACMFSVITHQVPEDSKFIFSILHDSVRPGGQMYFTAFLDETITEYVEGVPDTPSMKCYYNPSFLGGLVESEGWKVLEIYKPTRFQQHGFRCRKD